MKRNQNDKLTGADCSRQMGWYKRMIFHRIVLCLHKGLGNIHLVLRCLRWGVLSYLVTLLLNKLSSLWQSGFFNLHSSDWLTTARLAFFMKYSFCPHVAFCLPQVPFQEEYILGLHKKILKDRVVFPERYAWCAVVCVHCSWCACVCVFVCALVHLCMCASVCACMCVCVRELF